MIFHTFSNGVKTNRDAWAYNFNRNSLTENMSRMIDTYNEELFKWGKREDRGIDIDAFVTGDSTKISWSGDLKQDLERGKSAQFSVGNVRRSLYRPYTESHLYFDRRELV